MNEQLSVVLPVARTRIAEQVLKSKDTLSAFLGPGIDPRVFIASLIVEANDMKLHLKPDSLEDPRTVASFMRSAMNAAVVGLIPGTALGHCYFIPYAMKKASPHIAIQWIPGYRGYLELAFRNNFLSYCSAEVVLTEEEITRGHRQTGPWIEHVIPVPRHHCDRTTLVGVYCTYGTRGGAHSVVFVERAELDAVDTKRHVWSSHYAEMAKKTAVRRAAKQWQITQSMASAIMLDEEAERGDQQSTLYEEAAVEQDPIDMAELPESDG